MTTATADPVVDAVVKRVETEVGKRFDAMSVEQKAAVESAVKAEVARLSAELEAKYSQHSLPGSADATHKGKPYSLARAMASIASRDPSIAPMETAMHEELKKSSKAMSFATDTAGGFLVPNEVAVDKLIPLLYAKSIVMDLGATNLQGLTKAPFQIPRVSGGTTAGWFGEAGTLSDSSMATELLSMSPHGLYAVTIISDLLQQLDNPSVEQMIAADQARQMALSLDLKALKGTGASNTPIGVINATGVNASAISNPPTYDELSDAIGAVEEDNALDGNLGWAISWADLQSIRKMKDVTGGTDNKSNIQPLGPRSLIEGARGSETLLGFKVRMTTQLAVTEGPIFGNWADMVVGQWGGLRLDMTNVLGLLTGQSHIRTLTYADIALRHAVSFNVG